MEPSHEKRFTLLQHTGVPSPELFYFDDRRDLPPPLHPIGADGRQLLLQGWINSSRHGDMIEQGLIKDGGVVSPCGSSPPEKMDPIRPLDRSISTQLHAHAQMMNMAFFRAL